METYMIEMREIANDLINVEDLGGYICTFLFERPRRNESYDRLVRIFDYLMTFISNPTKKPKYIARALKKLEFMKKMKLSLEREGSFVNIQKRYCELPLLEVRFEKSGAKHMEMDFETGDVTIYFGPRAGMSVIYRDEI